MPTFAFDKILKIVQVVLAIVQMAIQALTGQEPSDDDKTE